MVELICHGLAKTVLNVIPRPLGSLMIRLTLWGGADLLINLVQATPV
jgi:hypothetical protein